MRTSNFVFAAALVLSISSAAQQATDTKPSAQPPAPQATQTAQPPQQSAPAQTDPAQAPAAAPSNTIAPPPPAPAPTTMDQVVNLFIEREHGLIKILSSRTPVVETYLQNLAADPQLGPIPSEDHYFLGRLDMGESVDRKDYLKEEEKSMQTRLLGGFQKLYKVQYQPMGFSWMVYADGTDYPAPRNSFFFHMDSWRLNLIPGYWVPAFIYSEEGDFSAGAKNKMAFKAQT